MQTLLLWVQLILPFIVLVWLSVMPIISKVLFGLHILMAVMIIASIGMLAPWAMPPSWVPWVYGFLAVAIPFLRKEGHLTNQPHTLGFLVVFTATLALIGLTVFGGIQSVAAVRGHAAPYGDIVDLELPFREGRFIVENGGATLAVCHQRCKTLPPWRSKSRPFWYVRLGACGRHIASTFQGALAVRPSVHLSI